MKLFVPFIVNYFTQNHLFFISQKNKYISFFLIYKEKKIKNP